jgi:integrase
MASKKKVAAKPQVWNKGLEVGKRNGFTPAQVKRIRGLLADRGIPGLRDLALFSTAVDTMLHGQDLLPLVVREVQHRNGSIRPVIEVARARGKPSVRCALSKVSAKALAKWIASSGKKRTDYLFPGDALGSRPMSGRQLNRLLKLWVAEAGFDPTDYGVESLRRTKPLHILKALAICRRFERSWAMRQSRAQRGISVSQQRPTRSRSVEPSISDGVGMLRRGAANNISSRSAGVPWRSSG